LLAELSREDLLLLYPEEELPQVTDRSIRTRSQLLIDLGDAHRRGYAANFGELENGIGSVAVAVRGKDGRALASIAVGAPMSRIDDARIVEMVEAITTAATALGEELSRNPGVQ
jgi:DNA-binding IclR family transcriptional regulator